MSRLTIVCLPTLFALALFVCPAVAEPETCWIPQFVNCPDTLTMNHCDSITHRFKAVNPHSGKPDHGIRYHLAWGPGQIDSLTGLWTAGPIKYPGPIGVEISASHGSRETSGTQNCLFVLNATNRKSWITISGVEFGDTIDLKAYEVVRFPIAYGDSDACDQVFVGASANGLLAGSVYISQDFGPELIIEARDVPAESVSRVTVMIHSPGTLTTPHLYVRLHPRPPITVRVANVANIRHGQYADVDVTFDSEFQKIGGYNLLLAYDNSGLSFQSISMGPAFGPGGCGWEYFTYRFGAEGNCTGDCPSGLIRVVGMAETNNGPNHPACFVPDSLPATLITLRFLMTNDLTLDCITFPVRFYWLDCTDNTMITPDGRQLYMICTLADFFDPTRDVSDRHVGFPTYFGAQESCDIAADPDRLIPSRQIAFINGSVELACEYEIDAQGDINLNGLPCEVVDYELFRQYFTQGLSAFTVNLNAQIAASDVNHDGNTLSLTDLVSMNRVIRGELLIPVGLPHVSPNFTKVTNTTLHGLTNVIAHDTLGALFLIFDGEVAPTVYRTGPEPSYYFDGTQTRVLIAAPPGDSITIPSGYALSNTGSHRLLFAQAATKWGDSVNVMFGSITDTPDDPASLPTAFALHPNYPNPFNATTVISFDLPRAENVTLDIVNLLGQRVYTHSGQYNQGTHAFTWDGTDNSGRTVASGVYYFRLTAGEYSAKQKLMLLK